MAIIKGSRTLGNLKKSHSTKPSFNKAMRMDAKYRYLENNGKLLCKVCGYKEIDICHIKPINEFNEDDVIEKINSPNNLVALCPVHHRDFDKSKKLRNFISKKGVEGKSISIIIEFTKDDKEIQRKNVHFKVKELIKKYIKNDKEVKRLLNNRTYWFEKR